MQTNNQNIWQKIWQADRDHFIHPWTEFESFKKEGSIIFQSAKGAYIFDSNGKKYLDGIGGLWCINIGYGRKELGEVAAEQMERMAYFSTFGPHTTEFSKFFSTVAYIDAPESSDTVQIFFTIRIKNISAFCTLKNNRAFLFKRFKLSPRMNKMIPVCLPNFLPNILIVCLHIRFDKSG